MPEMSTVMRRSLLCRSRPPRLDRLPALRSLSKETPLVLHLGESTVVMPFSPSEAKNLGRSFNGLLQTFKDKKEAEKPQRWEPMKYRYEASGDDDGVSLIEVMCNPNAFQTAFEAKLMVSIQSEAGLKFSGEAFLSHIKTDLQDFIAKYIKDKE